MGANTLPETKNKQGIVKASFNCKLCQICSNNTVNCGNCVEFVPTVNALYERINELQIEVKELEGMRKRAIERIDNLVSEKKNELPVIFNDYYSHAFLSYIYRDEK